MDSLKPQNENFKLVRKIIGIFFVVLCLSVASFYFFQRHFAKKNVAQFNPISVSLQESNQVEKDTNVGIQVADKNDSKPADIDPVTVINDSNQIGATMEEAMATVPTGPRSKDPKIALAEAKTFAKPQITEGKYIDISLSHQNMVLFEDGKYLDAYLVSTGKASMPTPPGTYHIQNKVPRAYSKEFGLYMPFWMALVPSGSFGIHELPEWPGGYKEGANHLGVPVSHGCVRLGVGAAKRVYEWADIGTTVIIHK